MQRRPDKPNVRDAAAVAAFLLLAFGLRVFNLDGQSLWHDEGLSLDLASRGVAALLAESSSVDHPPLYFLLLRAWIQVVGASDFGIRALSVFVTLPVIPVLYEIARRWIGRRAAVATALLVASSPLYLHYAQEARMYGVATTLSVLSTFVLLFEAPASFRGRVLRWGAYGLFSLGALLSHYSAALILGVQVAFVLATAVRARAAAPARVPGGDVRGWLGAQAAVAAVGGLWLTLASAFSSVYARPGSGAPPLEIVRSTLVSFTSGHGLEPLGGAADDLSFNIAVGSWAAIGITALALLGLVSVAHGNRRLAVFFLGYLVLPFLGIYVLSAGRHDFTPRYLMVASPIYLLLVGAALGAVAARSRLAAGFLVIPLLAVAAWAVVSYGTDPRYQRDDFRGLSRYLRERSQPGDTAILNAGYTYPIFAHYADRDLPWIGLPAALPPSSADTSNRLGELERAYRRVWLVLWQDYYTDPQGLVRGWLEENAWQADAQSFPGLTLYLYELGKPVLTREPTPQQVRSVDLGQTVELLGYDLDESALETRGRLRVTLYWRARTAPKASYNVFVHLVNSSYRPVGGTDHRPANDRLPTDGWTPGLLVKDVYELQLAPSTAPGEYRLVVGMYDPTNWQYLQIDGTQHTSVTLQTVQLRSWNATPSPTNAVNARLGSSIALVGYDIGGNLKPGGEIKVVLYWRAEAPLGADYKAFVHLERDSPPGVMAQEEKFPLEGQYPTSRWQPGRYLRDEYFVGLPADLPEGEYSLRVGLYDPDSGLRLDSENRTGDVLLRRLRVGQ